MQSCYCTEELHLRGALTDLCKQEPELDYFLALPQILETSLDAANLLNVVRLRRSQSTHRKISAENAVAWCTQQIEMLRQKAVDEGILRRFLFKLQVLQSELSSAVDALSRSHQDIGTIRALIRRNRLPITSPPCDETPTRPELDWPSESDSSMSAIN
jgi:hypothetical protein